MTPLVRIWGYAALIVAALLALRGAFWAALALFLLSPAPVLAFARGRGDGDRLSIGWIGGVVLALAILLLALLGLVAMGGVPQVHEWRALLRG